MKKQMITMITSALLLAGCANLCEEKAPCAKKVDFSMGPTLFAFDSATLTPGAEKALDKMAHQLKKSGQTAQINGYTDATGNAAYNIDLSERRANAVAKYLENQGVAKKNLTTKGFGATDFVASNDTKQGRAQNRRVDIILK